MRNTSKIFKRFLLSQIVLLVIFLPAHAKTYAPTPTHFKSLRIYSTVSQGAPDKIGRVTQSASFEADIDIIKGGTIDPYTDDITLRLAVAQRDKPSWFIVSIPAGSLTQVDYYTWTLRKDASLEVVLVDADGEIRYDYKKKLTSQSVRLLGRLSTWASVQIVADAHFTRIDNPDIGPDLPDPSWLIVNSATQHILTIGDNYGTVHTYQVQNQGAY